MKDKSSGGGSLGLKDKRSGAAILLGAICRRWCALARLFDQHTCTCTNAGQLEPNRKRDAQRAGVPNPIAMGRECDGTRVDGTRAQWDVSVIGRDCDRTRAQSDVSAIRSDVSAIRCERNGTRSRDLCESRGMCDCTLAVCVHSYCYMIVMGFG